MAREYVAADLVSARVDIPGNLQLEPMYRPLIASMLERSATFRRQCLRLGGDPGVTVHLFPLGVFWTRGARALSRITRDSHGDLHADIFLGGVDDRVELIAHEFEHVIEQLDQIDLSSKAALPDTGVRATVSTGELFETTRATLTGLRVAREFREVRTVRKGD